jgi:hypothetical protein
MHMHVLCGRRCVWILVVGEALVPLGRCVCGMARRSLYIKLVWCHELHVKLLLVPAWCMDVCRNVDSFPFRQIFALPICPTFRRGHAKFFRSMYSFRRDPCMCVHVLRF